MAEFVYVDNSNVFIEGQRVSAVNKGMALNVFDAMENRTLDYSYRMDFGKLHEFVAGNEPNQIGRAVLFGSRPPANDTLWSIASKVGFEVVVEDRNLSNKEKKIDTGIVTAILKDAFTRVKKGEDVITLVAGDADYVPPVRALVADEYEVNVVFWGHASRELREACSKFVPLDSYLSHLSI